jgi:iron complex outermembrane receptor protein
MKIRNRFTFLIFMALGLVASISMSSAVNAQDEDATAENEEFLEEVIVTGSRIRRSDMDSISPISVFSETDLLESGHVTLEDFIQTIPSVNGGFYGKTVNNGNPGYATVSMRGLGSNRTLVLVDGLRMPSAGVNGFVDLNTIPVIAVERVEVLRDGASTTYGSDAIAGVVNIITKRNFEGASFRFQYDETGEGDGAMYSASALFGAASERANVVFAMEYSKRDKIMQGDRDFSACPLRENADKSLFCGGSGTSYPGQFGGLILDNEEIVPFDAEKHAFNFAKWSYMVTPQEVWSIYADSHFDLLQDGDSKFGTMTAFTQAMFTNRQSDQLMAAVGTFWQPNVPASNPFNPTGTDVNVARRLFETGGRNSNQDASSYRLIMGLEGEFNNGWNWDASYNYGRWIDSQLQFGFINVPRVENILDPALCAAAEGCPGIWDPFRTDTLTQDFIDYIQVNHSPLSKSKMETAQVNLAGDLGRFELPGGAIQWAVGYEHRKEEAMFIPDGAGALDMIYFVSPDSTQGGYKVDGLYGEMRLPFLEGRTFADLLAAEISVRRSDYSNLEDATTNWKFALEWGPIPSLRFRGVYAEGFRSANISELFGAQQLSAQNYSDPCINYGTAANATVAANCAADGLPPDFVVSSDQATSVTGGNPDLLPEESESITIGMVWTPESIEGLTASLDYFKINITDGVGTAGTNNIISGCYNSANFSSPWCDLMPGPTHPLVGAAPSPTSPYRDSIDSVSGVLITNANLADYETEGIDFALNYLWDLSGSQLNLGMMGTYLKRLDYTPFEGADTVELAGFFGEDVFTLSSATFNTWKVNFNFQWYINDWTVGWTPRWFDATTDINADDANAQNKAKSIMYHDIQGSYNLRNWNFAAGVRNLANTKPPYVSNNQDMNTINNSYDTAGRYFYGRISYTF